MSGNRGETSMRRTPGHQNKIGRVARKKETVERDIPSPYINDTYE